MPKFNIAKVRTAVRSSIVGEQQPSGVTFEGAPGYARDIKGELFLLAVTNMVGEDTFYESAGDRDDRYTALIRQATVADPEWTAALLRWLRGAANLRSAALVGAAEFTHAALEAQLPGGRQVVNSVLQRADEPGELLAYWTARHGRNIPKPVKRGVADAVLRLYAERSLPKYDSAVRGFRFGDVIDLVHPSTDRQWQGDLFAHALDRRHQRNNPIPESLTMLRARQALLELPVEQRRAHLDPAELAEAGMTWESLAGWLQGSTDDSLAGSGSSMDRPVWEAVIPNMGYMALLRNLRNFDRAEVSDEVAAKLAHPEQVARSRQLPMRFLSAYRHAPSLRWSYPLEQALQHSLAAVPKLSGRTLILVDTSSSMHAPFSRDGSLMRWDAAVVFGVALAARCQEAEVVSFSNGYQHAGNPSGAATRVFPTVAGESVLTGIARWKQEGYFLDGGTDTENALRRHFARHDRVVILTDEQAGCDSDVGQALPDQVPLYTWNLAGYRYGHAPAGSPGRHTFGGLTDQAFRMIPLLESGRNGTWPWEQNS